MQTDVTDDDSIGFTALHKAAAANEAVAVHVLGEVGADVEAECDRGQTCLHLACSEGSSEAVLALNTALTHASWTRTITHRFTS